MARLTNLFGVTGVAAFLCAASAATAAGDGLPFNGMKDGGVHAVARVLDGDSVMLKDGTRVRLAGVQAPQPARRRRGVTRPGMPLADKATAALRQLIGGRPVRLWYGGRRQDRYGRTIAHVATAGGAWVQGRMLALGWLRVATWPDNRAQAARMLALEAAARQARKGIWAHRFYRVRDHWRLGNDLNAFQIVRGRVRRVAITRRQAYLNYGRNWRRDFTISIARRDLRRFRRAGIDIRNWEGKRLRVRGWLFWRNGPMIRATHPEQIELLD